VTANTTYTRFASAILLAVYMFVAAPLQLFHHHPVKTFKNYGARQLKAYVLEDGKDSGSSCSICTHQLQPYIYNDRFEVPSLIQSQVTAYKFISHKLFTVAIFFASDRGPPMLA
jgi:hypothetical protein